MNSFAILALLAIIYGVFKFLNTRDEFRRRDAEKARAAADAEAEKAVTGEVSPDEAGQAENESGAEDNTEEDEPEFVLWEEE